MKKTNEKTKKEAFTLDEMKDKFIGIKGSPIREQYEYDLRMDLLGQMIKNARKERNLTQQQLGQLLGVQKAQISKWESSANSATIDTLMRIFKALHAEIQFKVSMDNKYLHLH
jgi:HTH-type transcriptional regulator / antitoxin HipB